MNHLYSETILALVSDIITIFVSHHLLTGRVYKRTEEGIKIYIPWGGSRELSDKLAATSKARFKEGPREFAGRILRSDFLAAGGRNLVFLEVSTKPQ